MEAELIFNGNSNNLTPTRPQEESLLAIAKMKQQNKNKYMVVLPSGIGKTYLSAFETYDFDGRILYLAHRIEILTQAKNVFKSIHEIKDKDIGLYNQKKKQLDKKIVFASVQAISRTKNLHQIKKDYFDYIILDEFHHAAALSYQRILQYFKPKYLLGITATPYRLDGKDILSSINYNIPYQMELKEGIDAGWLSPFMYYGLWDDIDYSDIKWSGYKYTEKDLNKKLLIKKRDDAVIHEVKKRIGARQTIGFCCSIKHVKRCVRTFNDAGFSTNAIHCEIGLKERRQIIKDFRGGEYQIIFTRDIFNEGVDFPEVECLLFLRPTFSKTVFFQQLGRGLRKKEGKENVIVLDFIGNYVNAYKIREWFKAVVSTGEGESYFKPEYTHKQSKVFFDDRIIDLFELQEKHSRYAKEQLVKHYLELKEKIGKNPSAHDMERYSDISICPYITWWGSWLNFKIFMKDNVTHITKNQIKEQYHNFYKSYKRHPSVRDIRKHHLYTDNTVRAIFGCGFSAALKEMGFEPKRMTCLDVSPEDVVKDYFKAKERVGRRPCVSTDKKYCELNTIYSWMYYCTRYFGSYHNFLIIINESLPFHTSPTKKDLIDNYDRVQKILKKPLIQTHLDTKPSLYHSYFYNKTWGSWSGFLEDIGVKVKITKEILIKHYYKRKDELGEQPDTTTIAGDYIGSYFPYKRIFGSWKKFLNEIGEEKKPVIQHTRQDVIDKYNEIKKTKMPGRRDLGFSDNIYVKLFGSYQNFKENVMNDGVNKRLTKKQIEDKILVFYKKNGFIPKTAELPKYNLPCFQTITDRFGSYHNFISGIGLKPFRNKNVTKKELIEHYYKFKKALGRKPIEQELEMGGLKHWYNKYYGSIERFLIEIGEIKMNKEELIDRYLNLKRKIKKTPSAADMMKIGRTVKPYERIWGSWTSFKKEMEESHKIST